MIQIQRCLLHLFAALGSKKIMLEKDDLSDKQISENDIQFLRVSLGQSTFRNIVTKDFLNIVAKVRSEVAIKETDEFIECC
jgi:hypothetical protein